MRKPLNEFNAEQQAQLRDIAINHFSLKNEIIAKMKSLYPNDEWELTKVIREKFFQGRQKDRESSLEDLQRMLSALNEQGKSASCAKRLRYNISYWNWKEWKFITIFCIFTIQVCSTLDLVMQGIPPENIKKSIRYLWTEGPPLCSFFRWINEREWEGGSLLIGPAWIMVGARPTEVFLRNHIRMLFSAHPSERGTALAEL